MNLSLTETPFALEMLSKFALAHTVFAAHELGIWAFFQKDANHALDVDALILQNNLVPRYTYGVIDHLVRHGVLQVNADGHLLLDEAGHHLIDDHWLAYIVFYIGGYSNVLQGTSALARRQVIYGADLVRDGYYVALGTEMMSHTSHHRSYEVVFDAAQRVQPSRVLDLGCGSARFLTQLVACTGATYGLGVDRDAAACALARQNVEAHTAEADIEIYHGDMHRLLADRPNLAGTFDVVTAMMVIHEAFFSGEATTLSLLQDLGHLLAPGGRLLILDKHTDILEAGQAPPYFTEYKLVHDLTNQDLYTLAQWRTTLESAGLRLLDVELLPPHTGSLLLSCVGE